MNSRNWIQSKILKRSVMIPSKSQVKMKRKRMKQKSIDEFIINSDFSFKNSKELEFKLKQLTEFTKNLRQQIKVTDDLVKKDKTYQEFQIDNGSRNEDNDASLILNNLENNHNIKPRNSPTVLPTFTNKENLSSIILSSTTLDNLLPHEIVTRIGNNQLILRALIDKRHENWDIIIDELYKTTDKLNDISSLQLRKYLLTKIKHISFGSIEKLDEMLLLHMNKDTTKYTLSMYECLFESLGNLKPSENDFNYNEMIMNKMKNLLKRYDETKLSNLNLFHMTQFVLNSCIKFASKLKSFDQMEYFLSKFNQEYGIQPNKQNYTTVIQFYTKINASTQAWNTFATMKFLSQEHKPDLITYNSMLHLCNKEKDYAKAIDLYQEMKDFNIKPSVTTCALMAKILATTSSDSIVSEGKSDSLRLLGWKYIHEIESNPELSLQKQNVKQYYKDTMISMMALAAYDGDVGLSRALYYKLTTHKYYEVISNYKIKFGENVAIDYKYIWTRVLNSELFNYLLLAYSKYNPKKLPLLLGYEEGSNLRRAILNSVDYLGRSQNMDNLEIKLPILPMMELNHISQILSESRALWKFNIEFGGLFDLRNLPSELNNELLENLASTSKDFSEFKFKVMHKIATWKIKLVNHKALTNISLNTFLTIPIRLGDKEEFILRLKEFTFQQHELDSRLKNFFDVLKTIEPSNASSCENKSDLKIKENENSLIYYLGSMKHKILANNSIYELIMKAATKFHDVKLAMDTWKARGEFRKTDTFQILEETERRNKDRYFAQLMVEFFTNEKMYVDAMSIILSSQKYINWTYPMVKSLHLSLIEIEDKKSISILLDIINKKSKIQQLDQELRELHL